MCAIKYMFKYLLNYLFFIPIVLGCFIGLGLLIIGTVCFFAHDVSAWDFVKYGTVSLFSCLFLSQLPYFRPITDFHSCSINSPKGTYATIRGGHVFYYPLGRNNEII